MTEEQIEALERVANTLRGMTMDLRIAADARGVLQEQAQRIDEITEALIDEDQSND